MKFIEGFLKLLLYLNTVEEVIKIFQTVGTNYFITNAKGRLSRRLNLSLTKNSTHILNDEMEREEEEKEGGEIDLSCV